MARQPIIMRVSDYAPDMPNYMSPASDNVLNVFPRTPTSYGPVGSPTPLTASIQARCQGAYSGLDTAGNVNAFAGDIHDLYQYTASATSWSIVSKSAGGYSTAQDEQWHFTLFGTRVIATNFADAPQSFLLGQSSKFADLATGAPKARYGATVKSFLMLANTSDPIYGPQPQRVWWSGNGDPTNWPTPGSQLAATYESSYQDLVGQGGWIKGIVGNLGNADALIFLEHEIWRAVFAGAPAVFDFFPMVGAKGTPAPGSIAERGGIAYYLGEDGFYVTDGSVSKPIGANKVDKTFYTDLDQNYFGSISSAIDPINRLYLIFYPGSGHVGATCNKMLAYNWLLDKWSPIIPLPNGGEFIMRALSFGYTLDQLYTILGYSLDTLPFPLDSRVWTGGSILLGIFDQNHKLNFFTGVPLAAIVEMSETQPNPSGVTKVINTRPIIDGNAMPSVSIGVRNRQVDTPVFTTPIAMDALGTAPQRAVGRYVRARMTVPSSSSWTNISGIELDGVPASGRY